MSTSCWAVAGSSTHRRQWKSSHWWQWMLDEFPPHPRVWMMETELLGFAEYWASLVLYKLLTIGCYKHWKKLIIFIKSMFSWFLLSSSQTLHISSLTLLLGTPIFQRKPKQGHDFLLLGEDGLEIYSLHGKMVAELVALFKHSIKLKADPKLQGSRWRGWERPSRGIVLCLGRQRSKHCTSLRDWKMNWSSEE